MPLVGNCLGAQAKPCTMCYLAQPVARSWTGRACFVVCPMRTGVGRGRCAALGIAALYHRLSLSLFRLVPSSLSLSLSLSLALYHRPACAHCDLRPTPMQQAPRLARDVCTCLDVSTCLEGLHLGHQKPITVPLPCRRPAEGRHILMSLSPRQGDRPEMVENWSQKRTRA